MIHRAIFCHNQTQYLSLLCLTKMKNNIRQSVNYHDIIIMYWLSKCLVYFLSHYRVGVCQIRISLYDISVRVYYDSPRQKMVGTTREATSSESHLPEMTAHILESNLISLTSVTRNGFLPDYLRQ